MGGRRRGKEEIKVKSRGKEKRGVMGEWGRKRRKGERKE